ncbi:hypothetical protein A2U01_0082160, partial [Trifolium medium]|nr:hypothetical protein [Trifolium medium]
MGSAEMRIEEDYFKKWRIELGIGSILDSENEV